MCEFTKPLSRTSGPRCLVLAMLLASLTFAQTTINTSTDGNDVLTVTTHPAQAAEQPLPGLEKPDSKKCKYTLKMANKTYKEGKPVTIDLKFKNVSDGPVTVWSSGFWPNHQVIVTGEKGADVPLTDFGKQCKKAFGPGGGRDKNAPRVIPPGETHVDTSGLDLTRLHVLKPGSYQVKVIYDDKQPPTPMRLTSNTVSFDVE